MKSQNLHFFPLKKKENIYLVEHNNKWRKISFKDKPLTDNTFSGWRPVSLLEFEGQYYLVKLCYEKECVIWNLDDTFSYINHYFFGEELHKHNADLSYIVYMMLRPFIFNKNMPRIFKEFYDSSMNYIDLLVKWNSEINLLESNRLDLLFWGFDTNCIEMLFKAVSNRYRASGLVSSKYKPDIFQDADIRLVWQSHALLNHEFYCSNPYGGKDILIDRSLYFEGGKIAFICFPENGPVFFLFSTGVLGLITHIYFPDKYLIISKNHAKNGIPDINNTLKAFYSALSENWQGLFSDHEESSQSCLVIGAGSENIYHMLVNDISGICKIPKKWIKHPIIAIHKRCDLLGLNKNNLYRLLPNFKNEIISEEKLKNINTSFVLFLRSNYDLCEKIPNHLISISQEKYNEVLTGLKDYYIILVGIRTGRRKWSNQETEIPKLINTLNGNISNLMVVFEGSYNNNTEGKDIEYIRSENLVVEKICSKLNNVETLSLVGADSQYGLSVSDLIELYVAPWGAGLSRCQLLCNKPGIIHTNKYVIDSFQKQYYSWERKDLIDPIYVYPDETFNNSHDDSFDDRPNWPIFSDYSVSAEKIYFAIKENYLKEIL